MEELYDFLTKLEEDTLKIDEKRMEGLFGELNDEQNNFISELRYKYFKLGFEIKGVLENFKNERWYCYETIKNVYSNNKRSTILCRGNQS